MAANVGTVYMDVAFDVPRMTRDLTAASTASASTAATAVAKTFEQKLGSVGASLSNVGKKMSLYLSAPIAGIGVLATKEFAGFESSMTKIQGLVGASREQVAAWTGDVRRIGTEFGIGAQDAADALYFVTSSGIKGAQAIDVLERSAKASAVGLGETSTVADLLTSALNAYTGTGLTAAKATDTLVAAVRDGKSEPDDLANSMGRVLPVAANMGVSFDQVAAAMAAMSMTGTDADEAATQLRGVLNALLKPSKQAETALHNVGLSSAGLRKQIGEQGLLPTLQSLVDALGDDSAATALVFDDVRALTGVMNMLGKNSEQTRDIFKDVASASGDLDKAFTATQETAEFKLNKALAEGKDALIEIGATIAPVVTGLASGGAKIAGVFNSLPGPVKSTVAGLAGVVAVTGPVVWGVGKIAKGVSSLLTVAEKFATRNLDKALSTVGMTSEKAGSQADVASSRFSKLASGAAAAGIAVGGLATAWGIWQDKQNQDAAAGKDSLDKAMERISGKGLDDARQSVAKMGTEFAKNKKEIDDYNASLLANPLDADYINSLAAFNAQLEGQQHNLQNYITVADGVAQATGRSADEVFRWVMEQAKAGTQFPTVQAATDAYRKSIEQTGDAAGAAAAPVSRWTDAVKGAASTIFGALDGARSYQQALRGIEDANRGAADAQRRVVDANRSYQDSLRRVRDAQEAVTDAQRKLNEALAGPSEDDQIGLERARLRVQQAEEALKGKFDNPLDRQSAELDLRQARADLARAEQAQTEKVAGAKKDLASAEGALQSAQADSVRAQQAVIDAQRDAADATLKVRDAQEQAARAAIDLDQKNADLEASFQGDSAAIGATVGMLERLKGTYPQVAAELQGLIDKVNASKPPATNADGSPADSIGVWDKLKKAQGRARGGSVSTGALYRVNEVNEGPGELLNVGGRQYLIPRAPGKVVPTAGASAGAQSGDTYNIEVRGGDQPRETARALVSSLRARSFLAGGR